jgi:hypothetical protein
MQPVRRQLKFATLDVAILDAQLLLASGYTKVGQWTLGQCCGHLANWMRYPMEGFPRIPLLIQPVVWLMRQTVGKSFRKQLLAGQKMDAQLRTISESVPPADADHAKGVIELQSMVGRWTNFQGPVLPSPLLGSLTLEEATKIQLIHCAHHLSFLIPKTNPA